VVPLRPASDHLTELLDAWLSEYSNEHTRRRYRTHLTAVVSGTGASDLDDLSAANLAIYADKRAPDLSTNTMRNQLSAARLFLRWCHDEYGHTVPERQLARLLASYPIVYGKTQSKMPATRLDTTGYDALISTCQDGTELGLCDELTVRLGVSGGMRNAELRTFTIGGLRRAPNLEWLGKRNKQRTAVAGPALCDLIARYLDTYQAGMRRRLRPDDPAICNIRNPHTAPDRLAWGVPVVNHNTLNMRLRKRACAAGITWMTVHDLKRSAARMMHEARSDDGGHRFDLLDIADVLDHDNAQVTKNCYIGPLGSDNKQRAADLFG